MSSAFKLWDTIVRIQVKNVPNESIVKIAHIKKHIFLLTINHDVYHGIVSLEQEIVLSGFQGGKFRSMSSCDDYLLLVNLEGRVLKYDESLDLLEEVSLMADLKTCCHGNSTKNLMLKVEEVTSGRFGTLFVTESGQLWASGNMPQIGIKSDRPKRVTFFENRKSLCANVGDDFAIVIVSKQIKSEDSDSDVSDAEVFVPNCTYCTSSLPSGQNLDSNLLSVSFNENSDSSSVASKSFSEVHDSISPSHEKIEKNIIFRNTEAARDFLTRQIMWMSSAGEEYLAECTDKPSRIIKENVTNMASLVYEGVKTLSKHVNGSFDNCDLVESMEDSSLPRITSSDEFAFSVSQGTSERDQSEYDVQERCNVLAKVGSSLLNCEVWTWGNVSHGQLGIGDSIKRERPMIITKLSNIGVSDVSVQGSHAAALTLDGRVYLWGRNDHNQVTMDCKVDQSSPRQFPLNSDERIRDVVCGTFQTILLSNKLKFKYLGRGESPQNEFIEQDTGEFISSGMKKEILASSEFILTNNGSRPVFILDFLLKEQQFLERMLSVNANLVKIISKKYSILSNFNLYEQLTDSFNELLYLLATNVHSLLEFSNGLIDELDIVLFKYLEEYLHTYKNYLNVTNDLISLGGFRSVSKIFDNSSQFFKTKFSKALSNSKNSVEEAISDALLIPTKHVALYPSLIEVFITNCPKSNQKSRQALAKWQSLVEDQKQKQSEAERTNKFWLSLGKTMEQLCMPSRRLIRESRQHPIQIQNASRFSSHWLILLTDILIHVNGSTIRTHHLSTVWVESHADEIYEENQIRLKMPEDELLLYTIDSQAKSEWLQAIQNGIKLILKKSNKIQPPAVRSAEYTFRKIGFYKDANYKGRWCNGRMQGTGKLQWVDGRVYTGQLSTNQIYGFGRMEIPNFGVYEGLWKDNYQNGFGILKYTNGDVYKGTFKDGLPNGHGSLKQGNFMTSAASIYIGDWIMGNKNGYGVMDNIATGEKYLGLWLDNLKHGCGLMVTSDGVYYEGTFHQGVFCAHGLMILEDGTHYEGDFKGAGVLNGKGTLTLNSGHKIEGNLSGSLGDGLKISNATLNLTNNSFEQCSMPSSFTELCIDPNEKWKCLFRRCYRALGLTDKQNLKEIDSKKIWQNIAVLISNSHRDSLRIKSERSLENSLNNLDTIPNFCRIEIDGKGYKELERYLQKAFESPHHPLGTLLTDLIVAYTTTYGGLRAHPLLLTHAVEELHSLTKRLYEIIKLLFPALPEYDKETCLDDGQTVNYQNILYPLLLPKIHSALFILYTLHNKLQDVQYGKRLVEWNKYTDCTLLAFLSVDQKFLTNQNQEAFVRSSAKDKTFVEAIETLQLLKTTFSPYEKLLIIQQTFEKMTEIVQIQLGKDYKWSMDDLFPAFLYVVVRARILQLGSEIHFIQDFAEPSLENGELGIMFTTLKACYQQILQEKGCIN